MTKSSGYQKFMAELKRRHVLKVVAVYAAAAFAVMQAADFLLPALRLPETMATAVAFTAIAGFPFAVALAWIFDLTPKGVQRTGPATEEELEAIVAQPRARRWSAGILALLATVVFLVGGWWVIRDAPDDRTPIGTDIDRSIAVLPFVNLSGDPQDEYFSDGLAEELMNALGRIPDLRVAARTSAFAFKGRNEDVRQIGEQLGVATVLEGSIRRAGDRVRVRAQLINVGDGFPFWADSYDRELTDIFAIQEEIAQAIVTSLQVALTREPSSLVPGSTESFEAYNHYLRGRYFWNQRTLPAFYEAIEEYNQAIAIDPDYARAYAGLAKTYVLLPEYGGPAVAEVLPEARAATERALALDPNLAEAYAASGYRKYQFEWDWAGAEADFQRAITLKPDYATARQWYAELLLSQRRFEESLLESRRAYELDPLAPAGNLVLALNLETAGLFDEAVAQYKATLELAPDFTLAYYFLAMAYVHQADIVRADSTFRLLAERTGTDPAPYLAYIAALTNPENVDAALLALASDDVFRFIENSGYLATLGRLEETIEVLEQAYRERQPYLPMTNALPVYDGVRSDSRFVDFLRKMGL
jgi:serine/threonine-protein kinase